MSTQSNDEKPRVYRSTEIHTKVSKGDDIGLPENFVELALYEQLAERLAEAELEVTKWKDEYFNVSKFATDYEEKAESLRAQNEVLKKACEFYAKGEHFEWAGNEDFAPENPSGEPLNWECGGGEGNEFTLENGGFARQALLDAERLGNK